MLMQSFCRVREHVIENLKRANNLVKNIATNQPLKELNASKCSNMAARCGRYALKIIFHEMSKLIS